MFLGFDIDYWILLGLFGHLLFFLRFVVQWIASERKGESVIPIAFWYLGIAGTVIVLFYAFHIKDPVFIIGYFLAFFIYIRNIMLIKRKTPAPQNVEKRDE